MTGTPAPAGNRARLPRFAALAAALLLPALSACSEPAEPLLGEWVSVGSERPPMTYIFDSDSTMKWVVELEAGPDTVSVPYRVNYQADPVHLDVGPWDDGPVAGRTLFGIVEIQGPDRFEVDFEPADPDGDGSERPDGFSDQAVAFVRKVN